MITVIETSIFREWLVSIKDLATRLRLARRLEKAQRGNLGDIKQLANFLYEMREFFGAGWRMYYFHQDPLIIVMLNGGGKKSQAKDIEDAKAYLQDYKKRHQKSSAPKRPA